MGDRLKSKSSVVFKSTNIVMLKMEANSVFIRLTSDMLFYFLMLATKIFWKRLIENYPTMLQFLSEILPLTWYQWISHSTSQAFSQLSTIKIFISHIWSAKITLLYGCNMWCSNARKENKPKLRKNIGRRIFKIMEVIERRGKLHNKSFPTYFQQIFHIHNGPNVLLICEHM